MKNLHELLVQSVVDYAIFMLGPNGHVMSWNTGAERIKGYAPDEIIGEHFSRFYTDEERVEGVPARGLRTAAEAGRFTAEGWRVRKDCSRFWAMVVIDPAVEDGMLVGFAKITRDMTEHRATQLAALEGERQFRLLVQGVTDYAIYMLSPEGRVVSWNAGAARIKGIRKPRLSVSIFPPSTHWGIAMRACRGGRLIWHAVTDASKPKDGAAERMAANSGRGS